MCKSTTATIDDEFIDEELQGIGVRFTDCTKPSRPIPCSGAVDAEHEQIRKIEEAREAEECYAFQKRRNRVRMICGLILTTAAMIAFIEYGQISYPLAMCFNAALSGAFGYNAK